MFNIRSLADVGNPAAKVCGLRQSIRARLQAEEEKDAKEKKKKSR
eukprot:CAMPEP_0113883668 /NCGR_PEP_ID=MMETSP0780_2-20120614/9751_1 /TAXON_ID=652834 /ORGANISM="Palpitomonas bilix" /LENGTH=44 /DNA_ID=CAMNT_0000871045 /DNA_START=198 /DNA_END=332 /DNA_ORIENTATION=- /assembly_acc=CAM_ASM_000599